MYLNCKTYYSFKYGTFSTEELVKTAADKGVTALALTNINSTYDAWDFVKHCRERNIKPLLGAEIRNGDSLVCILIAGNNRGLASIHRFISGHLIGEKKFPDTMPADGSESDYWRMKRSVSNLHRSAGCLGSTGNCTRINS
jgi:DNA polymerase III alpha subunit